MKFLSETKPMMGFSSFLGTGAFFSASLWYFEAIFETLSFPLKNESLVI